MKNWLGAAGRLCADFFLVLLIMVIIAALGQGSAEATASDLGAAALSAVFRLFPLAAIVAIFLGGPIFLRRTGKRFLSYVSALLLGFGLLVGFTELRRLDLAPQLVEGKARPVPGMIVENGARSLYVGHFEGSSAVVAIGCELEAEGRPILRYSPRAEYNPEKGVVRLGGTGFSVLGAAGAPRRVLPAIPGLEGRRLDERLAGLDALSWPLALMVPGGIALLAMGLAGFASLPRWPLVGFFFGLAGIVALLLLDSALMSPAFALLSEKLLLRLSLPEWPAMLVVAAAEAATGLILGLVALVAGRRKAE